MKQRRLQGGSLAGYIIVAVLLGVVLVGGLYGLQRYNAGKTTEVAGRQDKSDQRQSKDKDSKSDDTSKDTSSDTTDKKQQQTGGTNEDTTGTGGELPATGPREGLLTGLALAGLTYAGTSLVRSRSHRWTSRGN